MELLKIKGKEYKLRLTTRNIIEIEKRLGTNPLNVFMEAQDGKMPKMEGLLIILHGCLTSLQSNLKLEDVYRLYDDYCTEGGNIIKLVELLVKVFTDSGFIPKEAKN